MGIYSRFYIRTNFQAKHSQHFPPRRIKPRDCQNREFENLMFIHFETFFLSFAFCCKSSIKRCYTATISGGVSSVSQHTFSLAQYFHHSLAACFHGTGIRLAEIYCEGDYEYIQKQGAIISFNLLRPNGDYVGFSEVKFVHIYSLAC